MKLKCTVCKQAIRSFKVRDDWCSRQMHLKCWKAEEDRKLWRLLDAEEQERERAELLEQQESQRRREAREAVRLEVSRVDDEMMANRFRTGGIWEGSKWRGVDYSHLMFDVELDLALSARYRELCGQLNSMPYC